MRSNTCACSIVFGFRTSSSFSSALALNSNGISRMAYLFGPRCEIADLTYSSVPLDSHWQCLPQAAHLHSARCGQRA